MGWANRITLARAVLTLGLWGLVAYAAEHSSPVLWWTIFWIFVVAAASDVFDGMLARKLQQVSMFGRIADPLVDKMLTIGTLIVLLASPQVSPWLPGLAVALIFTREMLVTAVRGHIEGAGVNFQAISVGKYKMAVQCVAIGGLMLLGAGVEFVRAELPILAWLPGAPGTWNLAHALVWAATILSVYSGVIYVLRARTVLRGPA
ncbi:MAG: CDP-diacylglycerol--glycerol-3-phosphate 3-phosphatidyltransferase [Planctomycetota bacterium]|nr:CDP-diacylglycerol--glycerol-3-phosphate 3-phosphatidyltransferase [Planctomycetota bacterium]